MHTTDMDFAAVLNKIERYCASRERCASEIRSRLRQYAPDISEDEIEDALFHLKNANFWNEERYASSFVHDKHAFHYWGPMKIKYALLGKQVEESIVSEAMKRIQEEEYVETLYALLKRKLQISIYKDDMEARVKLSQYSQNKGYTYDIINIVLSRLLKEY